MILPSASSLTAFSQAFVEASQAWEVSGAPSGFDADAMAAEDILEDVISLNGWLALGEKVSGFGVVCLMLVAAVVILFMPSGGNLVCSWCRGTSKVSIWSLRRNEKLHFV